MTDLFPDLLNPEEPNHWKNRTPITFTERQEIERCVALGYGQSRIAREIKRSTGAIYYELVHFSVDGVYTATEAQKKRDAAWFRQTTSGRVKSNAETIQQVEKLRKEGYSFTRIAHMLNISPSNIPRMIDRYYKRTGKLSVPEPSKELPKAPSESDLESRVSSLELQIQILVEQIRSLNERHKKD